MAHPRSADVTSSIEPAAAPVALLFPPLVDSSFGSYFASIAVLAGFLEHHGIGTTQLDLNEEFATLLFAPERLTELGSGNLTFAGRHVAFDDPIAGSARWLKKHPSKLIDARGRHIFAPLTDAATALGRCAMPFTTNPDASSIEDSGTRHPDVVRLYTDFYAQSDLEQRIPDSVRLVGISVPMGPQLLPSLILADYLRKLRPDLRVILGGSTISLMNDRDLGRLLACNPSVDAAARFDGEEPLLAMARQALDDEWSPASIPGVSSYDGETVEHCPAAPGPNVNDLPPARYDQALLDRLGDPEISIQQARGCYWGRCAYCDFVEVYGSSPPFRNRKVDPFVDEVETQIARHGIRRFYLLTESIPPAFARRFSTRLIDRHLDITWKSFAMVDRRFDRDLLSLMREAGCEFLVVGMESTNTRVLKHVHKSADREENFRFVRDAAAVGMKLAVNIIPDLPTTTYAEALEVLDDLEQLGPDVWWFSIFPFEPTRSSQIGRDPERYGLEVRSAAYADGYTHTGYGANHLNSTDPAMTPEQREDIYARYKQFQTRVNVRGDAYEDVGLLNSLPGPNERVRLATKAVDIEHRDGLLVCTNLRTRSQSRFAADKSAILAPYRHGAPFTLTQLAEALGADGAISLMRQLISNRLLERAGTATVLTGEWGQARISVKVPKLT